MVMFTSAQLNHIPWMYWNWRKICPRNIGLPVNPHGVTTHKTNIVTFNAARASNSMLACLLFLGEHIGCDLWTPKLLQGKTFTIAALNVSITSVVQNQLVKHIRFWMITVCLYRSLTDVVESNFHFPASGRKDYRPNVDKLPWSGCSRPPDTSVCFKF
jgi:hypothetical protein